MKTLRNWTLFASHQHSRGCTSSARTAQCPWKAARLTVGSRQLSCTARVLHQGSTLLLESSFFQLDPAHQENRAVFPETLTGWACKNSTLFLLRGKTFPWKDAMLGLSLVHFLVLLQVTNPLTRMAIYQQRGRSFLSELADPNQGRVCPEVGGPGCRSWGQRHGLRAQSWEEEESQGVSISQNHPRPYPHATKHNVNPPGNSDCSGIFFYVSATWENWR